MTENWECRHHIQRERDRCDALVGRTSLLHEFASISSCSPLRIFVRKKYQLLFKKKTKKTNKNQKIYIIRFLKNSACEMRRPTWKITTRSYFFSLITVTVYVARDQENLRGSCLLTVQCPALLFDEIKSAAVASAREFLREPRKVPPSFRG